MPTISMFRGIKVCIYWRDHMPPHLHAFYGGSEVLVSIEELEVLEGAIPSKQLAGRLFIRKSCAKTGSLQEISKSYSQSSR